MGWYAQVEKAVNKDADTADRRTRLVDFRAVEQLFDVKFKLDVCALDASAAKCERFYSPRPTHGCAGVDGLAQPWDAEAWDNPPWANITPWVRKHWEQASCPFSVAFLPNDRAERAWWQLYVEPFLESSVRYDPEQAARQHGFELRGLHFTATNLPGRPAFDLPGGGSAGEQPMCGIVVLAWDRRARTWDRRRR